MQAKNLVRFILALSTLAVVVGEETRFPDFSCHEEYDWDHPSVEGGEKYVQYIMKECKEDSAIASWDCFQRCVLGDILHYEGGLDTEESIANFISHLFKGNNVDTAKPFAARMVAECSDIAEETIALPCSERTKLYDCLDRAAGCKQ